LDEIPFTDFSDGIHKVFGTHRLTHSLTHRRTDPITLCLRRRFSTVAEAYKGSGMWTYMCSVHVVTLSFIPRRS